MIAVDIGNRSIKLGWFDVPAGEGLPQPTRIHQYPTASDPAECVAFASSEPVRWRVISVHRDAQDRLSAWVAHHRPQDEYLQLHNHQLPITVNVLYPQRVGADRLAAAVAANCLRATNSPAIVVDAGTAITVDLIDGEGVFQGGAILPGLHLAALALAEKTDLLPLVGEIEPNSPPPAVGKSTETAIRSGLFWGSIGAVREVIRQIELELLSRPQLFVTGGWANNMAHLLRDDIQYVPHLVLGGVALASRS